MCQIEPDTIWLTRILSLMLLVVGEVANWLHLLGFGKVAVLELWQTKTTWVSASSQIHAYLAGELAHSYKKFGASASTHLRFFLSTDFSLLIQYGTCCTSRLSSSIFFEDEGDNTRTIVRAIQWHWNIHSCLLMYLPMQSKHPATFAFDDIRQDRTELD